MLVLHTVVFCYCNGLLACKKPVVYDSHYRHHKRSSEYFATSHYAILSPNQVQFVCALAYFPSLKRPEHYGNQQRGIEPHVVCFQYVSVGKLLNGDEYSRRCIKTIQVVLRFTLHIQIKLWTNFAYQIFSCNYTQLVTVMLYSDPLRFKLTLYTKFQKICIYIYIYLHAIQQKTLVRQRGEEPFPV